MRRCSSLQPCSDKRNKLNEKDFGMDITFKSPENTFKSLLSLAPGIYTKDFGKIETKGDLSFAGLVKGTYSGRQMPAFRALALDSSP